MKKRHQQKLVILAISLLFLLNIPIVLLFDGSGAIYGIPNFYVFIFLVWLLSVFFSYTIIKRFYE